MPTYRHVQHTHGKRCGEQILTLAAATSAAGTSLGSVGAYQPSTRCKLFTDRGDRDAGRLASDELFCRRFFAGSELMHARVPGYHTCPGFERGLTRAAGYGNRGRQRRSLSNCFAATKGGYRCRWSVCTTGRGRMVSWCEQTVECTSRKMQSRPACA